VSEPACEETKRPAAAGNGAGNKKGSGGGKRGKGQAASGGDRDLQDLQRVLTQTLAGLKQSGAEPVLASTLKRAVLRKDPTFSEADYGFRAFGELLRQLERNGVIALADGAAPGDPAVDFPAAGQADQAFSLLQATVKDLQGEDEDVPLSGLKDQIRKRAPGWSEKDLGYAGFLQFVKAAASSGALAMEWDDEEGDYFLYVPS
jgi:OST-HTH/LOTUS domain